MLIFILLYADDTIILAETSNELQNCLTIFEDYCNMWKLSVNVAKTKIMVFSKRKFIPNQNFLLCDSNIEIVESYSYLGLLFSYNGKFNMAKKKLVEQAQKAVYALYRKTRNMAIPIDLQLKLFDSLIEPILLYACEIWGFENINILEKVHLRFLKNILSVRSSTPNFMVYGETGRYPLAIKVKTRVLNFWTKLLMNQTKLSGIMYNLLYSMYSSENYNSKWLLFVKSVLDETGLSLVWNNQSALHSNDVKIVVKQILCDQFIQKWHSDIDSSSRGQLYSLFKADFCLEKYLIKLEKEKRLYICKLRCSNLKFPIEVGRWHNVPREDRLCTICNDRALGNEFHYLFTCKNAEIVRLRNVYIPGYYRTNPTENKFKGLLYHCNVKVLNNLAIFMKKLTKYL